MSDYDSRAAMGEAPPPSPEPFPPPPIPPKPPVPGECCERGCEWCMWTYYHEAVRRYEAAEAEWRRRYGRPARARAIPMGLDSSAGAPGRE